MPELIGSASVELSQKINKSSGGSKSVEQYFQWRSSPVVLARVEYRIRACHMDYHLPLLHNYLHRSSSASTIRTAKFPGGKWSSLVRGPGSFRFQQEQTLQGNYMILANLILQEPFETTNYLALHASEHLEFRIHLFEKTAWDELLFIVCTGPVDHFPAVYCHR